MDNVWKSRIADLELSGYNPYNKDECFIQFVTGDAGDYIREHYSMCDRFAAERFCRQVDFARHGKGEPYDAPIVQSNLLIC